MRVNKRKIKIINREENRSKNIMRDKIKEKRKKTMSLNIVLVLSLLSQYLLFFPFFTCVSSNRFRFNYVFAGF